MKFELFEENNQELINTLIQGVREHRNKAYSKENGIPLIVTVKDKSGKLVGGISGVTIYKNFLINVLWVDINQRGKGLGKELMQRAEQFVKDRECLVAQVDTLSFQAPEFYQKLGFKIKGIISGFEGSPERYFLLKEY